jgi:hypothetical protein
MRDFCPLFRRQRGVSWIRFFMRPAPRLILIFVAFASAGLAQAPSDTPPEQAAVIANDRAYEAAYANGDAEVLADFFTEDAEYTAEDGRTFKGRAEIQETIRAALQGGNLGFHPGPMRETAGVDPSWRLSATSGGGQRPNCLDKFEAKATLSRRYHILDFANRFVSITVAVG